MALNGLLCASGGLWSSVSCVRQGRGHSHDRLSASRELKRLDDAEVGKLRNCNLETSGFYGSSGISVELRPSIAIWKTLGYMDRNLRIMLNTLWLLPPGFSLVQFLPLQDGSYNAHSRRFRF